MAGSLIQQISRRLKALGYSLGAANWLITMHLSNGTLEILDGDVCAQIKAVSA